MESGYRGNSSRNSNVHINSSQNTNRNLNRSHNNNNNNNNNSENTNNNSNQLADGLSTAQKVIIQYFISTQFVDYSELSQLIARAREIYHCKLIIILFSFFFCGKRKKSRNFQTF
jgi:hypothetical protein